MKYYNEKTATVKTVSFKLLDKTGKVISNHTDEACFSAITYYPIPNGVSVVAVHHRKSMVPYDVPAIKRWIADINEMGFPCSFVDDTIQTDFEKQKAFLQTTVHANMAELAQKLLRHGEEDKPKDSKDEYVFEVRLDDFEYKSHFISTLMLIRCLTESLICKVPEIYLQMMDANPGASKFETLQNAHKKLGRYGVDGNHNTNHMITFADNGSNVSKETLWKRYKDCGYKVFDPKLGHYHSLGQASKWNGDK